MDPITGLAALAGISLASIAALRLKQKMQEGFAPLPDRSTNYAASVRQSQSRYNQASQLVNPITNSIIPVGSSSSTIRRQRDTVNAALGSYSAEFSPDSSQTLVLRRFTNKFPPRADTRNSLYGAIKFCRESGKLDTPFTVYNPDGSIKSPGAVSRDGTLKFDEICGVCMTDGVDEEGNRFRTKQGMVVDPDLRDQARAEQEENGWPYPRIGPAIGTCQGAPNTPVFATSAKDLAQYGSRQACLRSKTIGGSDSCALCYESDSVYSSVPSDTEIQPVVFMLQGVGTVSLSVKGSPIEQKTLSDTSPVEMELRGAKEGDSFVLDVSPPETGLPATVYGYLSSTTPRGGLFTMPLNLLVTIDDETGSSPSKSGGFYTFTDLGLDTAKIRPGPGKSTMKLRGVVPFTFVQPNEFSAMDCLDTPYQTKESSASAFSTDQPCFAKGSRPGSYTTACLQQRILESGCTNDGDLYKNPTSLLTKDGSPQSLQDISTRLQGIANLDMIDPAATKQCSGRTIQTPCDPFVLNPSLKFGEALRSSNPTVQQQANQCLSFLYHNRGADETVQPPRVGPTYTGLPLYRHNQKTVKNIYCLPDGALNPDTNTSGKETLIRIADNGYNGKTSVDAIKAYLTDQLSLAIDTSRNANTDSERKAAITNCFGRSLSQLPPSVTGNPTRISNPCGVVAQFVRILPSQSVSPSDAYIEISQLAVINKDGQNVAPGKSTAGTSPSFPPHGFGTHSASFAIDGQLYPKSQNFYISAGAGGTNQFLLNLGAPTDITKIIYITRGDSGNKFVYRKQGVRVQLLDANQTVLRETLLNSNVRQDISYLQPGAASSCKSDLPSPAPIAFPPGFTPGLFVRFFDLTDANPDIEPGNRGWGARVGAANAFSSVRFSASTLPKPEKCGLVAKGYYIAPGPETLSLYTESDDGIYISFNNRQIIRNWSIRGPQVDTPPAIQIQTAGIYPFEIRFFQWGGGALCNMFYKINDEASWRSDLSDRFAYKPADTAQEESDYQTKLRAQQQTAALAAAQQGSTGLRISFPDGRTVKNDNGVLRLNKGTEVTFDLTKPNDLYKVSSGSIALMQTGTQNYVRHTGLVAYVHPFTANNGDFSWTLVPSGNGYHLKNEFAFSPFRWIGFGNPQMSSYLGYDSATDSLILRSYAIPSQWIAWTFTPRPSAGFVTA